DVRIARSATSHGWSRTSADTVPDTPLPTTIVRPENTAKAAITSRISASWYVTVMRDCVEFAVLSGCRRALTSTALRTSGAAVAFEPLDTTASAVASSAAGAVADMFGDVCHAANEAVDVPSTVTRTSLSPRCTVYLCSLSRSITTRTMLSRYWAARTLVTPPRATRSYMRDAAVSFAPLRSSTMRGGPDREKSWTSTDPSTAMTTSARPAAGRRSAPSPRRPETRLE